MMRALRDSRRGAFLLEALIATWLMGMVLIVLIQVRNNAMYQFNQSTDQHTASWLAELKLAELISQDLPDPEDEETWYLQGSGDFSEFNARVNALNYAGNVDWTERDSFSRVHYEWTKELIFIGKDFIGNREALEAWEEPLNESGDPMGIEDPRSKPAARVVRVTLTVYMPVRRGTDSEGNEESEQSLQQRGKVRLVTYVDPSVLHQATIESAESAESTGGE